MALNLFKKNLVVGVSVTPGIGLEVAQIDYINKTVLKYGTRPLAYDSNRKEIADLDVFKETLSELLIDLDIPKGSDIVLNIPTVAFKVTDYPASLNEEQVTAAIEEEMLEHPIFQSNEACISAVLLPNSTIQFNKIATTVAQKNMLTEVAMQIQDLGFNVLTIDTSINSILNAIIYNNLVNVAPDNSWVMLVVENNFCRILPMQGRNYVDCYEEKISIGEVLGDAENYSIVSNAINPILKNIPTQCLYVISKTDLISAKALASSLDYKGQIVHLESNCYNKTALMDVSVDVQIQPELISLDVIGAAINQDFANESTAHFNLFNKSLGDIYTMNQPLTLKFGSLEFVLSLQKMIVASIFVVALAAIAIGVTIIPLATTLAQKQNELQELQQKIITIEKFLNDNKSISTSLFDEGDEVRIGLTHNKKIYSFYTIVGSEIPKKLWLTSLDFGKYITINGQADNLESVYSFFRNIKDYNAESDIKLQKLGLASNSGFATITTEEGFDTDSIITSMNADFYEFKISNAPEVAKDKLKKDDSALPNNLELEPLN